jgi:uracil-DNA glycosylase family 4
MPIGFFTQSEMASSKPPVSRIAKCGACGLYLKCKSPKMPTSGKGQKKILIVGEAPGENEDKENRQFCGQTGRKLESALAAVGINMRRDCWLTNSLICRPPNNTAPTSLQIDYCRPNLIRTIEELKPEIIILVGGAAIESLISWVWKDKVGQVSRWIGWHIPSQKLNAWICPIWHPSFVSRVEHDKKKNPEVPIIWREHLKQIGRLSGRPWNVVPNYKKQVRIIMEPAEAVKEIEKIIATGGYAAFDYETNTLKPEWDESRIVCCSICQNGDNTIAFPWSGAVVEPMRRFARSPIRKIASNLKFEERWCRWFLKTRVRNWWHDTMIDAHILDNRRGISSIKFQSFIWLGADSYNDHITEHLKAKGESKVNNIIREVEITQLLTYNGLDSLLEYHTAFKQRKEMNYAD